MVKFCKCVNVLLLVILLLISFLCAGLGAWLIFRDEWSLVIFGSNSVRTFGWVVIGGGILLFVTSLLGICGLKFNHKCSMLMFLTIIVVGFLLLTVTGGLLFSYQNNVHDLLRNQASKEFSEKYGFDVALTNTWDELQSTMSCCGMENGADYRSTKWFHAGRTDYPNNGDVPSSCCHKYQNGSYVNLKACINGGQNDNSKYIFTDGCLNKMGDSIRLVAWSAAIALFIFAGILLVIILSGCIMFRTMAREVTYGQVV